MFSAKVLTEQNLNTSDILETNIEESYFANTLQFIKESMDEYRTTNTLLYKNILESQGDQEVINESFSDFFQSVKKIIDRFLKYIKSLFDRFIVSLNKFISSDKYIRKNKDKFKDFTEKHNFTISGYEYSFSPSIPLINAQAKFEESFVKLNFEELRDTTDQKQLYTKIKEKCSDLNNMINNDWYDDFRGEVISKSPLAREDYAEELFKIYRSDSNNTEEIDITNTYIMTALSRFEDYKKTESSIKSTKDRIEKDYESIKKHVQGIYKQNNTRDINKLIGLSVDSDYDKAGTGTFNVSTEVMNQLDLFIKKKVEQIVEMSNIHSLAFSYKLDAVKDCYKQDKDVLYKALSKLAKDTTI